MTIIHLLIGLGSGGAEHFVLELAKENKNAGYKVYIISISSINKIEEKFIKAHCQHNISKHFAWKVVIHFSKLHTAILTYLFQICYNNRVWLMVYLHLFYKLFIFYVELFTNNVNFFTFV